MKCKTKRNAYIYIFILRTVMEKYQLYLVITSYINTVAGQAIFDNLGPDPQVPDKCHIHDGMYKQCCVFPPFFTRDVARECGGIMTLREYDRALKIVVLRRQIHNKCGFWNCILTRYDLLDKRGELLEEKKYFEHLDRWVTLNPHFSESIAKAKVHCNMYFRVHIPLNICQFFEFQQCIRNYVILHCPQQAIKATESCEKLKKFYEQCAEYFI